MTKRVPEHIKQYISKVLNTDIKSFEFTQNRASLGRNGATIVYVARPLNVHPNVFAYVPNYKAWVTYNKILLEKTGYYSSLHYLYYNLLKHCERTNETIIYVNAFITLQNKGYEAVLVELLNGEN